jgi:hypothetical protein
LSEVFPATQTHERPPVVTLCVIQHVLVQVSGAFASSRMLEVEGSGLPAMSGNCSSNKRDGANIRTFDEADVHSTASLLSSSSSSLSTFSGVPIVSIESEMALAAEAQGFPMTSLPDFNNNYQTGDDIDQSSKWKWLSSCSLDDEDFEERNRSSYHYGQDDSSWNCLFMNKPFAYRLIYLEQQAKKLQYELAVLSTLGGAYHLCNHPQEALFLAHRLELLGIKLGAPQLILKAKGFKAVNIGLLGDEKRACNILTGLKEEAAKVESEELEYFFRALKIWLKSQKKYGHLSSSNAKSAKDSASSSGRQIPN